MNGFRQFIEARFPDGEKQHAIKRASREIMDAFRSPPGTPYINDRNFNILTDAQIMEMHKTIKDNLELIGMISSEDTGVVPDVITRMLRILNGVKQEAGDLKHFYSNSPPDFIKSLHSVEKWVDDGFVGYARYLLPSGRRQDNAKLPHIFISTWEEGSILNTSTRMYDDQVVHVEAFIEFTQSFIDGMFAAHESAFNYIKTLGSTRNVADWDEVAAFASTFRGPSMRYEFERRQSKDWENSPDPDDWDRMTTHGNQIMLNYSSNVTIHSPLPSHRGLFLLPFTQPNEALPIPDALLDVLRNRLNYGRFSIVNDFDTPLWVQDEPEYRGYL